MNRLARTYEGYPIVERIQGVPRYTLEGHSIDLESSVDPRTPHVDMSGDAPMLVKPVQRILDARRKTAPSVVVPYGDGKEASVTFYATKKKHPMYATESRAAFVAEVLTEHTGVIDETAVQKLGFLGVYGIQERVPHAPNRPVAPLEASPVQQPNDALVEAV